MSAALGTGDLRSSAKCMRSVHSRAEAARVSMRNRKRAEGHEARKREEREEIAKLGFKVGGGKRITIGSLQKTKRGKAAAGVSAIMGATARAKHATKKTEVSKRDVKDFLAGTSNKHAADDEEVGLTRVASATTAAHGATATERLSEQQIQGIHSALQAMPAVRTAPQRALICRLLSTVHLFSNLSFKELRALAEVVGVEDFVDGDVIMTEGEPGEEFCIILSGKVDIIIGGRYARRSKARQRAKTIGCLAGRVPDKRLSRTASPMTTSGDRSSHSNQSVSNWSFRRNVKDDKSRLKRDEMTKEELKEWEGTTVGQMQAGATFGELALLDSAGVRTAVRLTVLNVLTWRLIHPD